MYLILRLLLKDTGQAVLGSPQADPKHVSDTLAINEGHQPGFSRSAKNCPRRPCS